jgi:undecaprenyl-diphosphatase
MDTNTWQALLLGIVEGLTEFIPVSSTGHLILLIDILKFSGPPGRIFEIIIQLGAILAVMYQYKAKLFPAAFSVLRAPAADTRDRRFLLNILIAFMPSVVLGFLLHDFIKTVLFNPLIVSVMLVVGGVIILLVEKFKPEPRVAEVEDFDWKLALKIGCIQTISMIPGTSRSGATIMGGLMLGASRKAATEFSFLLALPTMLAAATLDIYKHWDQLSGEGWQVIAIGFTAAFVSALLVVRWVVGFVSRHGFAPFAYYRIALGLGMLALLLNK